VGQFVPATWVNFSPASTLWALATTLQTWIGSQVVHGPAWIRAVAAGWTTTGRLSIWAQGRFALAEPSGCLHDWLFATLQEGARRVACAPATPVPQPPAPALRPAA
jgi:hypothetical protein